MMKILVLISSLLTLGNMTLFDFNHNSDLSNWTVVDDVVMGGRSNGGLRVDEEGHGIFSGYVSLENYGGFSSVRYNCDRQKIDTYNKAVIRLRGDGKAYQFRCKTNRYDRHSYIYDFQTSGDWETIEIPLHEMQPRYRCMRLNMPDYPAEYVEEIAFLIGNKKNEEFSLQIDFIELR